MEVRPQNNGLKNAIMFKKKSSHQSKSDQKEGTPRSPIGGKRGSDARHKKGNKKRSSRLLGRIKSKIPNEFRSRNERGV